jgi:hypothetical protein
MLFTIVHLARKLSFLRTKQGSFWFTSPLLSGSWQENMALNTQKDLPKLTRALATQVPDKKKLLQTLKGCSTV